MSRRGPVERRRPRAEHKPPAIVRARVGGLGLEWSDEEEPKEGDEKANALSHGPTVFANRRPVYS